MTPEENFAALNLVLPSPPKPVGVYKPFLIDGNHCYVSGHGTLKEDGTLITGRIGEEGLSMEEGKAAAQQVGLAILSTLKQGLGSLDKIKRKKKEEGKASFSFFSTSKKFALEELLTK